MEVYGIIYMTSRLVKGRVVMRYIGLHRFANNSRSKNYLGSGILLTRAIKKYGRQCFHRETLEECHSYEELKEAEARWVKFYNAVEDPSFYNLAEGGMSCGNLIGRKVYQYSAGGVYISEFPSAAAAAKSVGALQACVAKACVTTHLTVRGFQFRYKYRKSYPAVIAGCERVVECFSKEGNFIREFNSLLEAAAWAGYKFSANISACCRGLRPMCGEYQWRIKGDKKTIFDYSATSFKSRKRVNCLDVDTKEVLHTFTSINEAAKHMGIFAQGITIAIKKPGATSCGYRWEFADA